jgi:hypothetical protein
MIVTILFSLICCLAMGAELKIAKLILVIEDKSITPARAFSTQNVNSIVKCVYLCLSNNSCMSVSYKHNGECKLCNRGWNSFCAICEDDPGAVIYSKVSRTLTDVKYSSLYPQNPLLHLLIKFQFFFLN